MTLLTSKTFFVIHFLAYVNSVKRGYTIHHCEIGDGLVTYGTIVHAIGTNRIPFSIEVYIHIDIKEVITCNAMKTGRLDFFRGKVPSRMPAFVVK